MSMYRVFSCVVGRGCWKDSWESLGLQGDPTSPFWRRSALGFLWREWCWSWNSSNFGHLRRRVDSLEKTLIEGRRRRGWQRMRWLDGITNSMDMSVSKLQKTVKEGSLACSSPWGRKELDTTEQLNWTELNSLSKMLRLRKRSQDENLPSPLRTKAL